MELRKALADSSLPQTDPFPEGHELWPRLEAQRRLGVNGVTEHLPAQETRT